ncbi:hypothetical protein DL765_002698 [Monosporascus sp. GIB2]|nr:hypothetical protein DL765_002698 [Monosporascus sp. GIB2]
MLLIGDEDFKPGSFYTDEDFYNYSPKGLASVAAQQMNFSNLNPIRKFGWLSCRLQLDYQMKVGDLSDKLFGLDVEIEEGLLRTTSPPNPGQHSHQCWERDRVIGEIRKELKEYYDLILAEERLQHLPKVSKEAHTRHYNLAEKKHCLSNEQLEVLRYAHDFITVTPDTTFQKFEFLLYSEKPWVQVSHHEAARPLLIRVPPLTRPTRAEKKCLEILSRLAGRPPPARGYTAYGVRPFEWLVKGVLALVGCALFLAPVGILYLGSLPPGALFGVTVAFCFVFVTLMVSLERRTGPMLFGISAYMAVMTVFLSNVNQCHAQPQVPLLSALAKTTVPNNVACYHAAGALSSHATRGCESTLASLHPAWRGSDFLTLVGRGVPISTALARETLKRIRIEDYGLVV